MNIGEVLIWESSNLLLLIPVVIGLVMAKEHEPSHSVNTPETTAPASSEKRDA
jgi:hypothetical protein